MREETRLRHSRIKELFFEASRLSGEPREEFLRSACGGDAGLRREIESLLAYHDGAATASEPDLERSRPEKHS